jgi:hypothetical protein
MKRRQDVQQGTLAPMVLKTLDAAEGRDPGLRQSPAFTLVAVVTLPSGSGRTSSPSGC